jgi:MMP 1-O-methyltransferase
MRRGAGDQPPADRRVRAALRAYRERVALKRSSPGFKRVLEQASQIEGFTAPVELSALYCLARAQAPRGQIVEIGSYLGRSTIVLARAAADADAGPIYAVDPHTAMLTVANETPRNTHDEFLANVRRAEVEEHVRSLLALSTDAARSWDGGPVSLLFIDGYHSREAVLEDWHGWAPYLTDDACVVFDDYLPFAGVRTAVRELMRADVLPTDWVVVGKMLAAGPRDVMHALPVQPGARLLARMGDRALNRTIRLLAT